jgi:hypothetical protein
MFARKCVVWSKQEMAASRFQQTLAFKFGFFRIGRHGLLDSRRN